MVPTIRSTFPRSGARGRGSRAGFTLIEIMAVILILSLLVGMLVFNLRQAEEATREKLTESFLLQVGAAIDEYESEFGDYPPGEFSGDEGLGLNELNTGAERLVVALYSLEWQTSASFGDDELCNSDGDSSRKSLTVFGTHELFELADAWQNPIAYIHSADYGRGHAYRTYDAETGEELEASVRAHKSAKTGRYQRPRAFQLISAGPDGIFGNEDDITNFSE
jgi:prepilin-type N-terminal cleavage/methylation domain-containing protein